MKKAYRVEYILNDDGDTTVLHSKKSLNAFITVIEKLNGSILRVKVVLIAE